MESRLQFIFNTSAPACIKAYDEIKKLIKKEHVSAFLASTLATCTSNAAAQAAHKSNIPVVVWQHGAFGHSDSPIITYTDIRNSDYNFVYGTGVAKKYRNAARRFGTLEVPIGSALLDDLSNNRDGRKAKKFVRLSNRKKTVLYVTTCGYHNSLYISHPPPFSDNLLWLFQKAIMDILAKHPDYNVIVKTHPSHFFKNQLSSYANKMGYGYSFVKDECRLTDLLPLADMIVIDFPSTVLLESLTTSKPIFTCTQQLAMDKQAEVLLKKRAYCYPASSKLIRALDDYLASGNRSLEKVDLGNREFLKMYGTHIDDGKSAKRAGAFIKKLVF